MNVPGRKNAVKTEMTVMLVLSRAACLEIVSWNFLVLSALREISSAVLEISSWVDLSLSAITFRTCKVWIREAVTLCSK
jgi:hypothetical protein